MSLKLNKGSIVHPSEYFDPTLCVLVNEFETTDENMKNVRYLEDSAKNAIAMYGPKRRRSPFLAKTKDTVTGTGAVIEAEEAAVIEAEEGEVIEAEEGATQD